MNIVVRIMGLLLAVIAVDMIAHGLRGEFPILTKPLPIGAAVRRSTDPRRARPARLLRPTLARLERQSLANRRREEDRSPGTVP
jgi:hypothetical protein